MCCVLMCAWEEEGLYVLCVLMCAWEGEGLICVICINLLCSVLIIHTVLTCCNVLIVRTVLCTVVMCCCIMYCINAGRSQGVPPSQIKGSLF